jgi:adenosine deaminase
LQGWTTQEKIAYLRGKGLPELHRHFDGAIRPQTLWHLSEKYYAAIPGMHYEGFVNMLSWDREHDRTLLDYLDKFHVPLQYTQFYDNIRQIAFEICEDAYLDGVRTFELRINPVIHRRAGLTNRQVLNAVRSGMKLAQAKYPDFECGVIVIAIRGHGGNMAKILLREVVGELAEFHDSPGVVGFDIAGAERPFPPILFQEAYALARRMGMSLTAHAGEDTGPENVWQAIDLLGAERIGHGTSSHRDEELMKRLAKDGITLEVCLSSNLQTGAVDSLDEHPLRRFLDAGIPVTLATDNPTVSATTLTQEYLLAIEHFGLTQEEVDHLIDNGQKASFLHRGPQADGGEGSPRRDPAGAGADS